MPPRQLALLEPPRPLLERFGAEFFRRVPAVPGVYVMSDAAGRILYVGQSSNLRQRLGSYRSAHPDRVDRKTRRLLARVHSITWETCPSPASARLRENELLRLLQPQLNRANARPQTYRWLTCEARADALCLALTAQARQGEPRCGTFKPSCAFGFAALVRLLWQAWHPAAGRAGWPAGWMEVRATRTVRLQWPASMNKRERLDWLDWLLEFMLGRSRKLIDVLVEVTQPSREASAFEAQLHAADVEALETFYRRGPRTNQVIAQLLELPSVHIPADQLDDLVWIGRREAGSKWMELLDGPAPARAASGEARDQAPDAAASEAG